MAAAAAVAVLDTAAKKTPSERVDRAIDTWESLTSVALLSGGRIASSDDGPVRVELTLRQASLARGSSVFYAQSVAVSGEQGQLVSRSCCREVNNARLLGQVRHDGSGVTAAFVSHERDGKPTALLELWDDAGLLSSQELLGAGGKALHGRVPKLSSHFGGACWSPDGTRLVYTAEQEQPTSDDWLRYRRGGSSDSGETAAQRREPGRKFERRETWGEQTQQTVSTRLFVVEVRRGGAVSALQGVDEDLSCSDPQWSPDGSAVVFVGTSCSAQFARRLGVVYCSNRAAQLYCLPATASADGGQRARRLSTSSLGGVRSPRFSPDGRRLVFLDASSMSTHRSCDRLCLLRRPDDAARWADIGVDATVVVDTVQRPAPSADAFPGVYCHELVRRPWLTDAQLLLTSHWHSTTAVLCVDVDTAAVAPLPVASTDNDECAHHLLDVHADCVLIERSSFVQPPQCLLGRLLERRFVWLTPLLAPRALPALSAGLSAQRRDFVVDDGQAWYQAFLLSAQRRSGEQRTLLAIPHGGPHSCFSPVFSVTLLTFCLSGFDVLLVNYRGSVGFGQRYIDELAGRCGSQDVSDVHAAIADARQRAHYADVVLHGGSHGGFLVGHLVGQYPALAAAAVLRNPVTNIASMVGGTDIRDWCFVEACGVDSPARTRLLQTAADNQAMFACSPIAHAAAIKTPCLFLVGANDLRVPPYQAVELHHVLRCAGVDTALIEYPDNHTLSDVPHDFDGAINAVQWFDRYTHSF